MPHQHPSLHLKGAEVATGVFADGIAGAIDVDRHRFLGCVLVAQSPQLRFAVLELDGEYFGFTLDGDGRFLLGDFTVTHNTSLACQFDKPLLLVSAQTFSTAQYRPARSFKICSLPASS